MLLVLLHDFPEFLCEYHFQLCNVIPPSCIQMRNLILSAFPRNMRLPDPFTPNLKVDLLPEINQSPRFVPEPQNLLPAELRYCLSPFSTHLNSKLNTTVHIVRHHNCPHCAPPQLSTLCATLVLQLSWSCSMHLWQCHRSMVLSLSACTGCLVHSWSCAVQDCCGRLSKGA